MATQLLHPHRSGDVYRAASDRRTAAALATSSDRTQSTFSRLIVFATADASSLVGLGSSGKTPPRHGHNTLDSRPNLGHVVSMRMYSTVRTRPWPRSPAAPSGTGQPDLSFDNPIIAAPRHLRLLSPAHRPVDPGSVGTVSIGRSLRSPHVCPRIYTAARARTQSDRTSGIAGPNLGTDGPGSCHSEQIPAYRDGVA